MLIACVCALLAGMTLQNLRSGAADLPSMTEPPPTDMATPPAAADPGPGPWTVESGIPVGFARSDQGAVAAAASYASIGQVLLDLAPTEILAAVQLYAADETADEQTVQIQARLRKLRDVLAAGSGRARYIQAVLATRLDSYSPERAEVVVWSVGVLWRRGAADPQAGWTMSTYELVWEDETWMVLGSSTASGPSPAPNSGVPPVDAAELDRQLDRFEQWGAR